MVVTVGCGQQITGNGDPGAPIVTYKSVSEALTSFGRGTYFAVFARLGIDWLITICTVTHSRHGGRLFAIHNRFGQTINGILDAAGPAVSKLFRFLQDSMSTISFEFKEHEVLTEFSGHCGSAGKQTRQQTPLSTVLTADFTFSSSVRQQVQQFPNFLDSWDAPCKQHTPDNFMIAFLPISPGIRAPLGSRPSQPNRIHWLRFELERRESPVAHHVALLLLEQRVSRGHQQV